MSSLYYCTEIIVLIQVACGLINKPQNEIIKNIDASDVDDELAAVEYVDDIYKYYKLTEVIIYKPHLYHSFSFQDFTHFE